MKSQLRPIPARLLKSAIDTLRPHLSERRVLDLYAGTGRFGLAALKECAAHVTFVEKHRATAAAIKKANATVIVEDVFRYLEEAATTNLVFDIIFADPPFEDWNDEFQKHLFQHVETVSVDTAIFLVKHPSRMLPSARIFEFSLWKSTAVGDSRLSYYRYEFEEPE